MKTSLSFFFLSLVFSFCYSGCAKNPYKDFENPGISFLYGEKGKNDFILRPSASPQKVTGILVVNLRSSDPANADIRVTLTNNTTALLNSYNTANGTSILPLPANLWNIPSEMVIKKGEQHSTGEISVSNTLSLNFNNEYAIGVTITGVSDGKKIADNLENLFIIFKIQNALDGRYKMNGESYHPSIAPFFIPHHINVELHTTGPNSVLVNWPTSGYNVPVFNLSGNPVPLSTSQELSFNHNTATNTILCQNSSLGGTIFFDPVILYNGNTYNNRWDALTKTVYSAWGYNLGPGGTILLGGSTAYIDTLTYLGPR